MPAVKVGKLLRTYYLLLTTYYLLLTYYFTQAPYGVASAFNGAALYPLEQLRVTGARYDTTEASQGVCEHIPFHSQLRHNTTAGSRFSAQMYVSPKWAFFVSPHRPPGPTGQALVKFMREQASHSKLIVP